MFTIFCLPSRRYAAGLALLLTGWLAASAPAAPNPLLKTPPPPAPIKFGQPDPADFEAKNFVADSAAAAVVLCDYGTTRYGSSGGNLAVTHERLTRIKILKKSGYDQATVEVPLYHHNDESERLGNLRGFTYVRGADGKIVKTKLDSDQVVEEKRTSRVSIRKFTMPAVQVGAVLEFGYTVTSTMLGGFHDWEFQRDIPTRWSEYRAGVPLAYVYKTLYHGYLPLDVNEVGAGSVTLVLTDRVQSGVSQGVETGSFGVTMNTNQFRWVVKNAPAFRREPYMTAESDYLARMEFELVGTQWPNEQYRDLADSWPKKNKALLEHEQFGQVLDRGDFLQPLVLPLATQYADPAARAAAVREWVLQHATYDGTDRLLTENSLKHTYEQHRGTAAELNLLLLAALRQAGLPAQPLILSTRAHGQVSQEYPLLDQFNYVVALVPLASGKELLLDATDPLLPAGTLPARCLTSAGHTVVSDGDGRWVSLLPDTRYNHFQNVELTLDAQGNLSGQVREESTGYAGRELREKLLADGEKKCVTELAGQHPGCELAAVQFTNPTSTTQPVALRYDLRQAASGGGAASELYINPLKGFGEARNPFDDAHRIYPVDIGMMQQEVITLSLTLPPGYVAELPKPAVLALPNDGGRYTYSATAPIPGKVQLLSRLVLNKPRYTADEYQALRELYRQMLAKQAEALVVKKG